MVDDDVAMVHQQLLVGVAWSDVKASGTTVELAKAGGRAERHMYRVIEARVASKPVALAMAAMCSKF